MQKIITALLLATAFANGAQAQKQNDGFVLNGKITGQTDGYIYLSYRGPDGKYVRDSAAVTSTGTFQLKGQITEPVLAYLNGKTISRSIDDPNATSIFLEPAILQLALQFNEFKKAQLKGSKTNDEYEVLQKLKEPIRKQMQPVSDEYRKASDLYTAAVKRKASEDSLMLLKENAADIREKFTPYNERMKRADLHFFSTHPGSYVTAYMMRAHVNSLSLDSLQLFYNKMNKTLQQSAYGKDLAAEIQKLRSGSPGSKAQDFMATDIHGKKLRLSDFKGKYVLLDFWASWCVPCRRGNPHLKELYAKYKDKGIEFIGVSDDDRDPDAWRKAVERDGLPWRHVLRGLDMEKRMKGLPNETEISDRFGIHTLPTKILVDPAGVIIGRYSEAEEPLDKKLAEIFERK